MTSAPPPSWSTAPRRRAPGPIRVLVVAAVLVLAGCSDQDPGLDPATGGDGPAPTSDTLGRCPPGGPDATTPPAGCLTEDGQVVRG